uniref:Protein MAINTENANCE OF MERISTEMS-like n=1 Tax=Cicer arietinum TaxID=3827 RepID=A0A1S2Z6Q6_CICAR|nr:protein MAINTENANCE OF MERISTEMS-like [Cicer arietinum]
MRGAFGQIIRNLIGDRGDGVERIPPTASNRRRNEANRPIRQRRRRQEEVQDDDIESTEHAHMEEDVPQPPQMEHAADDVHDTSAHADESDDAADIDDQDQQTGFPGGPTDCGSLKVITHGLKLKKFAEVPMLAPVEHWIQESGLMHLSSGYLTMADAGLISAFVGRWHREINSFHLPFGEMTITLDDVATLLHISPHGKIFDAPLNMNTNNAARAAHEYLGATWGVQYRLQWLRDLYSRLIQTNQFECAARTYLLHLVGCTIFSDKTHMRVVAKYVTLFIDLHRCRDYSWASAVLVFLYDNLGDGVVHDTRQLGGYMTLLQCWIYEHFPRICKRGDRGAVPAHLPRACRWTAKHVVKGGLMAYRRRLDALLLEDVVFTPYDDDRANHPFVSISMFSGYLLCGGVSVPYLPERCLRQFGRIQCIPYDVHPMSDNIDWVWQSTMRSSVETFRRLYLVATFPVEVTADYYAWYISVSHPLILPPSTIAPSSPHTTVAAHAGPSSSAHAGRDHRDRRDRSAAELAHRALDMVTPFSEIHDILSELCRLYDD